MSNEIKDWVLVPRVPDAEMLDAAIEAFIWFSFEDEVDAVFAAMIAAAPTPPAEAQAVGGGDDPQWFADALSAAGKSEPLPASGGEARQWQPNYERMFIAAVASLAEISVALGIPDEVAETAFGNTEILAAIAALSAQPRQDDSCICEGVGWSNPQDHLPNCPHTAEVSTSSQPRPNDAKWITDLRAEAEKSAMKTSFGLTRNEVLVLTGSRLAPLVTHTVPADGIPSDYQPRPASVDRWGVPPCVECGAVDAKDAETKCHCSGDKDDCHGVALWPDGASQPASAPVGVEGKMRELWAEWHRRRGLGQQVIDDCLSGNIQMPSLAADLVRMALAQQPAAVDESAIRRALDAHGQALGEGTAWGAMRTALYASLAQPQGEK